VNVFDGSGYGPAVRWCGLVSTEDCEGEDLEPVVASAFEVVEAYFSSSGEHLLKFRMSKESLSNETLDGAPASTA